MFEVGQELDTDKGIFEVINTQYISSQKIADYYQLRQGSKVYLLKSLKTLYEKHKQQIPFIKTHLLGADLASLFNLKTQTNTILWFEKKPYLLIEDIRNTARLRSIESLDYYSDDIGGSTIIGLNILFGEFIKYTSPAETQFFLKQLIFDLYIGNSQRDAYSIRLFHFFEDENEKVSNSMLIDHNFGSSFLCSESQFNPLYSKLDVSDFLTRNRLVKQFIDLVKEVNIREINRVIQERTYLNKNQKRVCTNIISRQNEYMISLVEINKNHFL